MCYVYRHFVFMKVLPFGTGSHKLKVRFSIIIITIVQQDGYITGYDNYYVYYGDLMD